MKKVNPGFSLIELMTSLVILGVLAIAAMPAYKEYVKRSRMAESYQTLGTMITQHKAYYANNGNFTGTPNNGTGGGNSLLGGDAFTAMPEWEDVGFPITPGTPTYFAYGADAGKNDDSGTPDCAPFDCDTYSGTLQSPTIDVRALFDFLSYTGFGKQCSLTGYTPEFFGVLANQPSYDWVILTAKGNLTPGNQTNCEFVMTILEADENGMGASRGFITFSSANLPSSSGDEVPQDE